MTKEEQIQDCANKQKGVGALLAVLVLIAAGVFSMANQGPTKWGIIGVIAAIIAGIFWKGNAYKTLSQDCSKA